MDTRSSKNALVWGSTLIIMGGLLLVQSFVDLSPWIWVAGLVVMGVITFVIYTTDTSQWWILIPTFALWAIAGLVALIELNVLRDEIIATYVLTVIALPFLYVFLRDRSQWWALIPAYILFAIGLMVGLIGEGVLEDLLIPAYVLLTIAFPFFVVYLRDTKQWWALIPGGIIGIIGLSFLLAEGAFKYILPAAIILVGAWILLRQFIRTETPVVETSTPISVEPDEPDQE
jgi:hypothetical protein